MMANSEKEISLSEFKQIIFDKIVPINELLDHKGQPISKILPFWRRKGLLPYVPVGKWLETISFSQLIWIRILDDLRKIHFPVEKMLLVCDYFYKDAYHNELPMRNLEFNKAELMKRKAHGIESAEDDIMLAEIEHMLKHEPVLNMLKFDINYLSNFIAASISNEEDGNIYIFFDGSVAEYVGQNYYGHTPGFIQDFTVPHIRLTISHYLKEFINDNELSKLLVPQLLNDDETKVLREMRRKNIKEIIITRSGDTTPMRIESSSSGIIQEKEAKEIMKILGLKNYDKISINTLDGSTLSFKKTRKRI